MGSVPNKGWFLFQAIFAIAEVIEPTLNTVLSTVLFFFFAFQNFKFSSLESHEAAYSGDFTFNAFCMQNSFVVSTNPSNW